MLPDPILPIGDDIARQLTDFEKRLSHLERLENFESDIGARVSNAGNLSIPNGVFTLLTYDTEQFDTDNIHSLVLNTGRLTAQTAGKYIITAAARFDGNGTGTRAGFITFNGSIIVEDGHYKGDPNGNNINITTHYDLAIGDFLEFLVFQAQAPAAALNVLGLPFGRSPAFMMQKVG